VLYTDVLVFGGVSTGGCTAWQTAMGGALDVTHLLSQFNSLTMVTYDYSAGTPVTSTCTSPKQANAVRVVTSPTHPHYTSPPQSHICILLGNRLSTGF